jgi:hypothetical protein
MIRKALWRVRKLCWYVLHPRVYALLALSLSQTV